MFDAIMYFIVAFFAIAVFQSLPSEASKLQAACEKELPRNQKCVMQFVPEIKEEM